MARDRPCSRDNLTGQGELGNPRAAGPLHHDQQSSHRETGLVCLDDNR